MYVQSQSTKLFCLLVLGLLPMLSATQYSYQPLNNHNTHIKETTHVNYFFSKNVTPETLEANPYTTLLFSDGGIKVGGSKKKNHDTITVHNLTVTKERLSLFKGIALSVEEIATIQATLKQYLLSQDRKKKHKLMAIIITSDIKNKNPQQKKITIHHVGALASSYAFETDIHLCQLRYEIIAHKSRNSVKPHFLYLVIAPQYIFSKMVWQVGYGQGQNIPSTLVEGSTEATSFYLFSLLLSQHGTISENLVEILLLGTKKKFNNHVFLDFHTKSLQIGKKNDSIDKTTFKRLEPISYKASDSTQYSKLPYLEGFSVSIFGPNNFKRMTITPALGNTLHDLLGQAYRDAIVVDGYMRRLRLMRLTLNKIVLRFYSFAS